MIGYYCWIKKIVHQVGCKNLYSTLYCVYIAGVCRRAIIICFHRWNKIFAAKGKAKFTLEQATKAQMGEMYSCTLSSTSALDGVGCQRHSPATSPLGKTRYPLYRRVGGPQGRSGRVQKISLPSGFDSRTVQPVASRYTDCAIPTTFAAAEVKMIMWKRLWHDGR
jgi:hypothetical protein